MKPCYQQEWPPKGVKWYYADSSVCIAHGDCREIVPQLGRFDLLLTDPPYELQATGGGIGAARKYLADIDGHIDSGFDMSLLDVFENWVVFCSKRQLVRLLQKAESKVWSLVTWNKPNPTPLCAGNYLPDTEYIVHAYKSGRLFGEYNDKSRFIVHPSEHTEFNHPTVKPIAVVAKMIRLGTQSGETILDPFAGSGTTGRAAKDLGRKCVLIEREERYCEISARRMRQEVLPLFGSQDAQAASGDVAGMDTRAGQRNAAQAILEAIDASPKNAVDMRNKKC